jgi:hypothetical protein
VKELPIADCQLAIGMVMTGNPLGWKRNDLIVRNTAIGNWQLAIRNACNRQWEKS